MNENFTNFSTLIHELEQKGLVTRTFRRLDPERQQAVLNAILEEAAEVGPAEINIKRVAERSGAAVGSLYQYFGNRDTLLAFVIELVVRTTVDAFNSYRPYLADMPLMAALRAYLGGGMEWTREQKGFARFFARAAYQGDTSLTEKVVRPIGAVLNEMVQDILKGAQARGELRPGIDLEATGRILNCLLIAAGDAQLLPHLNDYYQLYVDPNDTERTLNALFSFVETAILVEHLHETTDHHQENAD